jgi:4-aminobutyrate aminotransferase-like enzyme
MSSYATSRYETSPERSQNVDEDYSERARSIALLLTLGCGQRVLRLRPPLDVTAREPELGTELLVEAVDDVA